MNNLRDALNKAYLMRDNLNMPIDHGIIRSVAILYDNEFITNGSCQGHSNWGLPYPWIDFDTDKQLFDQKIKIQSLLDLYFELDEHRLFIEMIGIYGDFRLRGYKLSDIEIMNDFCNYINYGPHKRRDR